MYYESSALVPFTLIAVALGLYWLMCQNRSSDDNSSNIKELSKTEKFINDLIWKLFKGIIAGATGLGAPLIGKILRALEGMVKNGIGKDTLRNLMKPEIMISIIPELTEEEINSLTKYLPPLEGAWLEGLDKIGTEYPTTSSETEELLSNFEMPKGIKHFYSFEEDKARIKMDPVDLSDAKARVGMLENYNSNALLGIEQGGQTHVLTEPLTEDRTGGELRELNHGERITVSMNESNK